MGSRKLNLGKYFVEMLMIAFGVFLGVYVSEWQQDRRVKANTQLSLNYIVKELDNNMASLAKAVAYHQSVKENLNIVTKPLTSEDMQSPYFGNKSFHFVKIKGWMGINLPDFETIAFESAKLSGVFHQLDFELTQLISKAYRIIDLNEALGKSLMNKMLNMNSLTTTADAVGMMEMLSTDILQSEKSAQKKLNELRDLISWQARISPSAIDK